MGPTSGGVRGVWDRPAAESGAYGTDQRRNQGRMGPTSGAAARLLMLRAGRFPLAVSSGESPALAAGLVRCSNSYSFSWLFKDLLSKPTSRCEEIKSSPGQLWGSGVLSSLILNVGKQVFIFRALFEHVRSNYCSIVFVTKD